MNTKETRACWYRLRIRTFKEWKVLPHRIGRFHIFTTDHIEYETGPGPFPVAIVEDDETLAVYVIPAQDVCFGTVPKFAGD